jgi:preprotein translocase subunit YajC
MQPLFDRLVPAMGSQGQPGLVYLAPYALILVIIYVLVLLPTKRQRKKIQEFQDSLKVGDKVITTSGIYGNITRVSDRSVQLQIADKVRIEVSRAAIGGYQGQEPVVPEQPGA